MVAAWKTHGLLSEEQRATTRRAIEAIEATDFDALVAEYDPAVEFVGARAAPDTRIAHGPEAARELLEDMFGVIEHAVTEVAEIVEVGRRVLCLARFSGVGTSSGAPMGTQWAWIWSFHKEKIGRVELYRDWSEARRAAGLRT